VTVETYRILSDEEVLHWLSHNVGKLKDPKHQGEQDQRLLKMQISICTELMSRRNGPAPEGGLRVTELEARLGTVQKALQRVVDASDQFVRDTGLKHGDLITDAVEAARKVLPPAHIRAGVDFITDTRLGGD
jgi:hypothetical protein